MKTYRELQEGQSQNRELTSLALSLLVGARKEAKKQDKEKEVKKDIDKLQDAMNNVAKKLNF